MAPAVDPWRESWLRHSMLRREGAKPTRRRAGSPASWDEAGGEGGGGRKSPRSGLAEPSARRADGGEAGTLAGWDDARWGAREVGAVATARSERAWPTVGAPGRSAR